MTSPDELYYVNNNSNSTKAVVNNATPAIPTEEKFRSMANSASGGANLSSQSSESDSMVYRKASLVESPSGESSAQKPSKLAVINNAQVNRHQ